MTNAGATRTLSVGLIVSAGLLVACSQAPWSPSPATEPRLADGTLAKLGETPKAGAGSDQVTAPAPDADTKVGTGTLAFLNLELRHQNTPGVTSFGEFAEDGGTYRMNVGATIELWATRPASDVTVNPKFKVDWGSGDGQANPASTSCGDCRLRHTYPNPGLYKVVVSLDDRATQTVTRTFFLDSRPPVASCTSYSVQLPFQTLTTSGQAFTFNFGGAPPPGGAGTLTIEYVGDLNSDSEFYEILDEGSASLGTTPNVGQCDAFRSTLVLNIPQAALAGYAADGLIRFVADATSGVGNFCTGAGEEQGVSMRLSYSCKP